MQRIKRLLNTLYIIKENSYLSLDGENAVCNVEGIEAVRIPFDNIENIVCFNYTGCSPAFMGKCVDKGIFLSFISPQGKFLANVCGETRGSVYLRINQIAKFESNGLLLAQNTIAAKLCNNGKLIKRTLHDNAVLREDAEIKKALDVLKSGIDSVFSAECIEEVIGIEGNCAKAYFSVFDKLLTGVKSNTVFEFRSKRPPLDPVNAALSFIYTIYTNEFASALATVGLDSSIGYCHTLRSGRHSLACDLVEEVRATAERFVLTQFNLGILGEKDFASQVSGAVWLNDEGLKKILSQWQEKKRTEIEHPYLRQKIQFGLIPYIQSSLLAKYVRGDISEYPCYIAKG